MAVSLVLAIFGRLSGCVSSKRKYAMPIERMRSAEQMTLGKRYGNLAKSPLELNRDGKFSVGWEKMPPIEAVLSVLTWRMQC